MSNQAISKETSPVTAEKKKSEQVQTYTVCPPVDVFEHEDNVIIAADVPGVSKEGVRVYMENGTLTIEAESEDLSPAEPRYREFALRRYFRQFALGDWIDADRIAAELKNGVLMITLPCKEESKRRQVPISVG